MADLLDLLKDYGFSASGPDNKVFRRANKPNSDIWVRHEEGWLLYQQATSPFGGGTPWGIPDESFPGFMLVPYTQKPEFKDVSGVHPSNPDHAMFFQWIWPDEKVLDIYQHSIATAPEGKQWAAETDENGIKTGKYKLIDEG